MCCAPVNIIRNTAAVICQARWGRWSSQLPRCGGPPCCQAIQVPTSLKVSDAGREYPGLRVNSVADVWRRTILCHHSVALTKMTYQFHPPSSSSLQDTVVVLTGGALGVGASIVRQAHAAGAHVFFGDVLDDKGDELAKELSSTGSTTVQYQHCNVTSYADTLALFESAYKVCGRVDHAIANAGIGEQGNIFDPAMTLDSVKEEPKKAMNVVDVNLKGELYFARIASVYLRQGRTRAKDKSLTLVSSVAGFREDPGLHVYTPSKHGVLGLMRSLRE